MEHCYIIERHTQLAASLQSTDWRIVTVYVGIAFVEGDDEIVTARQGYQLRQVFLVQFTTVSTALKNMIKHTVLIKVLERFIVILVIQCLFVII